MRAIAVSRGGKNVRTATESPNTAEEVRDPRILCTVLGLRSSVHGPPHSELSFFTGPTLPSSPTRRLTPCLQNMSTTLPTILLKPGEADRIVAGHPWIYRGSIIRLTQPAEDGDIVQVKDHRQRLLGVGFFNSKSKINVRMLAPERVEIDRDFFTQRIQEASDLRRRDLPQATSYRVVNSEGDFLSGLIVDKYEDVLVVQTASLGMDQRKSQIVAALQALFAPKAILERNDVASRQFEGLSDASGVLMGKAPNRLDVRLNELSFSVPLLSGHKTGLYLDQQVNYQLVAERIAGAKGGAQVLDCFCFLGGFALHAAR